MKYQLENIAGMTAKEIKETIDKGGRFLIFKYHISFFAISLHRLSPAILIIDENQKKKFQKKYNLKNILFAPWLFPKGPYFLYSAIKYNNAGGLDVTQDILENFEELDPENKSINIKNVSTLFDHLSKNNFKELKISLEPFFNKHFETKELYVGRFINVEENIEPPFFIGIDSNLDPESLSTEIKDHVYKRFKRYVQFMIFTKKQEPDLFEKLKKQGQLIAKSGIKK